MTALDHRAPRSMLARQTEAISELEQCRTTLRHVRALAIDTERLAVMSEEVTDQLFQVCGFLPIDERDVDPEEEDR